MAYIGREPVYGSLVKQNLTPDGTTTNFTLNYYVSTAASLIVSVGGVIQNPDDAYSITNGGLTISFTEAPAADLTVFVVYLGVQGIVNTVADETITQAKLAANAVTESKISSGSVTSSKLGSSLTISGTMSAADFNSTSDIALKKNIEPITNPILILSQLNGIKFDWKQDGTTSYGFSAQEVEKVLPSIVKARDDGVKGINYNNLIAFLIESIKDLQKQIDELKK